MHAVLITFRSTAPPHALAEPFAVHAHGLRAVPGLVGSTWLHDGPTLGTFQLFANRGAADAYLDGAAMADMAAHPAFSCFRIVRYDVLDLPDQAAG